MKKVTLTKLEYNGETRIRVDFPYDTETIKTIKEVEGSRWSKTNKCWHVPYNTSTYQALQSKFDVTINATAKKMMTTTLPLEKCTNSSKEVNKPIKNYTNKVFTGNSIIINQEDKYWLQAYVPYDKKGWIAVIKEIP